jgi:hypothetical protein
MFNAVMLVMVANTVVMVVAPVTVMMVGATAALMTAVMTAEVVMIIVVRVVEVAAAVGAPLLVLLILHVKYARNMATPLVTVGGATLIVMMMRMIPTLRGAHMALIPTGTWTLAPLITLLEN